MKKFIMLSGVGAALLCAACSSGKKQENAEDAFPVTSPIVIDTVYNREYVADIQAVQNIELRARVKGFLDKVHVDEGASVKQGEVLFTISDREYREALTKAKAISKSIAAEVKAADLEVQNKKRLVEKNVISKAELEIAEANLEALQARAEEAQADESSAALNLSYTVVRAPFDGTINRIPNKTGSLIEEGMLLTTISDSRDVFAWFNMSESEYLGFVRQGNTGEKPQVSLLTADNTPYPYKGVVETVESEINKSTGNISFRARFANPDQLLRHGATGKIILSQKLEHVLVIPQKSTFEIQGKLFVYTVGNDDIVHMRNITPAYRIPHLYVMGTGITSEDVILYEGIQRVREGDKVSSATIPMSTIMDELSKQ